MGVTYQNKTIKTERRSWEVKLRGKNFLREKEAKANNSFSSNNDTICNHFYTYYDKGPSLI